MSTRSRIDQVEPAGYKAILGLEKFIESTPLTKTHKDLIKIRASQINGCAFCIDMHTKEARKAGGKQSKGSMHLTPGAMRRSLLKKKEPFWHLPKRLRQSAKTT